MLTEHDANVEMLLEAGADVNLPDAKGQTPFEAAIADRSFDLARRMLGFGARWEASGDGGKFIVFVLCNQANLRPEARPKLDALIAVLRGKGLKVDCK
jgi:ankyrin repeat protein